MHDLLANPQLLQPGRPALLVCATGKRSLATARALRERGIAAHSLAGGLQKLER
jgi:rhodanese-related sulfurtransferase